MPSRERQTADAIVAAFNSMDIDTIVSLRTPDCQRVFLPTSLKYKPQSNEAYRANLTGMKSIFNSFQITVNDVIEGTSETSTEGNGQRKKIVMFVSARGGTPVGEYKNDYVWKMAFEEKGARVSEWVEYVDVGMTRDFYPLLMGEMARRAKAAAGVSVDEG
ncbi:Nn.00g032930.m01.CDS01 [Neocucurbitaria sp. VM-36]